MERTFVTCVLLLSAGLGRLNSAELTSAPRQVFSHYVDLFETKWKQTIRDPRFLWVDSNPDEKAKAAQGEIFILPRKILDGGREIRPPGAMIQDWLGVMFVPKTNMEQIRSVMQDYKNYKVYYQPEVTQSKLIRQQGDNFEVFLRLYKKYILTVVLNTTYAIQYGSKDPTRTYITSRATRIAEVNNAGQPTESEEPEGNGSGFLWGLNTYWRFEEADGGVYAECEAISLSRDVPFGLGWAVKHFINRFPKESMQNTLLSLKRAVAEHGPGR